MSQLSFVADALRSAQDRALTTRSRDAVDGRVAALRSVRNARARARRRRRGALTAMGVVLLVAWGALSVLARWRGSTPLAETSPAAAPLPGVLTFAMGSGEQIGTTGAWLTAGPLHFSDGSEVTLRDGGALRVAALTARGADVVLERGTLHTRVVPRTGNRWIVEAGPFQIHVKGTEFDTTWDPAAGTLRVAMVEGHVVVTGDGSTRDVQGVETLELRTTPLPLPVTPGPTPARASVAVPDARVTAQHAAGEAERRPEPRATDTREAPDGAVDVTPRSADDVFASGLAGDILAVSEKARRAGEPRVAEDGYRALRTRFPGSDEASRATFLLARLVADLGRTREAEPLFVAYLDEWPRGLFAEEASARALELAAARGDATTARDRARRYLATFPAGAAAGLAQRLAP